MRSALVACRTFGVGWIAHVVPFHASASATTAPDPSRDDPTAVHHELEGHDTPFRVGKPENVLGSGVGWMDHDAPLHRSASASCSPKLFCE